MADNPVWYARNWLDCTDMQAAGMENSTRPLAMASRLSVRISDILFVLDRPGELILLQDKPILSENQKRFFDYNPETLFGNNR